MEPNKQAAGSNTEPEVTSGATTPELETAVVETVEEVTATAEGVVATETVVATTAADTVAATTTSLTPPVANNKKRNTVVALLIVAMMLAGVWYVLEKQDRVGTNVFGSITELFRGPAVAATVNGVEITEEEVAISLSQLEQAAAAQGMDVTSPTVKDSLRSQALDSLINAELLTQISAERGFTVTDEAIDARISEVETEIGGAEVLQQRMAELGFNDETLRADIHDELMIQQLLDQLVTEASSTMQVSDEEIAAIYASAAEGGAELPPLEEVRALIEEQVLATKEQELITQFLQQERGEATIEITPQS